MLSQVRIFAEEPDEAGLPNIRKQFQSQFSCHRTKYQNSTRALGFWHVQAWIHGFEGLVSGFELVVFDWRLSQKKSKKLKARSQMFETCDC